MGGPVGMGAPQSLFAAWREPMEGALSCWTPRHTGSLPHLTGHCYDGTRALLLASPVVPASSLIAPVQIYFSVGCPLPLGWMLFRLE